jgi:CubicO group peptidase (beta-lactamase class C family)
MRQLGRFYEQLLSDRGDLPAGEGRLMTQGTARLFTSCRLCDIYDKTFGTKLDWGYGFIVNAPGRRFPYNYGPHASAAAFGHSGNQSTCAFADPEHRLVVCWATNGMPGELPHQRRQNAVNAAVYEDLGL